MKVLTKTIGEIEINDDFLNIPLEEVEQELEKSNLPVSAKSHWSFYKGKCFEKLKQLHPILSNIDWHEFDQNIFYGHLPDCYGNRKVLNI